MDRDDRTEAVRRSFLEAEELIRHEQLERSDAEAARESELDDMRALLLERIRAKTRSDR
jgi:hypothetical protein